MPVGSAAGDMSLPYGPEQGVFVDQKPSVGRVVHYVAYGVPGKFPSVCRSAEITEVDPDGNVGLVVKNPTGLFFHPICHDNGPCPHDEDTKAGGTWHWPERI